jgi:opacity protein-like surface antigen
LEIFARGGVLFLDQEIERQLSSLRTRSRFGDEIWMAGAGAQWSFTSRWAARLEYQLTDSIEQDDAAFTPRGGTTKIEQLSLSVLFDF